VRGLKHLSDIKFSHRRQVARRVRAWIETLKLINKKKNPKVARRVRAWIETIHGISNGNGATVARRVRAWIETILACIL